MRSALAANEAACLCAGTRSRRSSNPRDVCCDPPPGAPLATIPALRLALVAPSTIGDHGLCSCSFESARMMPGEMGWYLPTSRGSASALNVRLCLTGTPARVVSRPRVEFDLGMPRRSLRRLLARDPAFVPDALLFPLVLGFELPLPYTISCFLRLRAASAAIRLREAADLLGSAASALGQLSLPLPSEAVSAPSLPNMIADCKRSCSVMLRLVGFDLLRRPGVTPDETVSSSMDSPFAARRKPSNRESSISCSIISSTNS